MPQVLEVMKMQVAAEKVKRITGHKRIGQNIMFRILRYARKVYSYSCQPCESMIINGYLVWKEITYTCKPSGSYCEYKEKTHQCFATDDGVAYMVGLVKELELKGKLEEAMSYGVKPRRKAK